MNPVTVPFYKDCFLPTSPALDPRLLPTNEGCIHQGRHLSLRRAACLEAVWKWHSSLELAACPLQVTCIYIRAHLGTHAESSQINSWVQQRFIGSDQLPLTQSGVNLTRCSPGCQSVLVLTQHLFSLRAGSLSYDDSLLHPIQFYTHFPHKPVRDIILIIQKSQPAIAPTSFFNEYRLHCVYFYHFSYFYFYFYCTDLCK